MSKKLYEEANIQDIADAIREKNGEETTYKVSEMAQAILDIDGGTGDMPNLDDISFGNNPTVDNPGYTNPQYYEDIADAINYAIEHGGESSEPETYSVNWDTSIVSSATENSIIYDGNFAVLTSRINFLSAPGTNKKIGTIPSEISPCGYYFFYFGNGEQSGTDIGYINPNGDIYVSTSQTYGYTHVSWLVPKDMFDLVSYDTAVFNSITGKIAVSNGIAQFSGRAELVSHISVSWKTNCIYFPTQLVTNLETVCIYGGSESQKHADSTYTSGTGALNIFIDYRFGTVLYIKSTWMIPQT